MPIHPAAIGFDLDCVVIDTMEAFIRLAREEYRITVLPEQITEFQVEQCLDMDETIITAIFQRLLDDPVGCAMRPIAGAVPVLRQMAAPTFITARPDPAPVRTWLRHALGDEIAERATLIAMGDHDGKAEHIRQQGLTCFIDDRFQTCEALSRDGIHAIVYEQPWNKNRHTLPTVTSWHEIAELCNLSPPVP